LKNKSSHSKPNKMLESKNSNLILKLSPKKFLSLLINNSLFNNLEKLPMIKMSLPLFRTPLHL